MFRDMLLTVAITGIVAALTFSAVQPLFISPLILQAEVYEDAAVASPSHEAVEAPSGHDHHESDWKPENGWERRLFTLGPNLLMGLGYAFLFVAVTHCGVIRRALAWGCCGASRVLSFSSQPPGWDFLRSCQVQPPLNSAPRQMWWGGTAAATALGLALNFGVSRWWVRAVGVALIIAPHLASRASSGGREVARARGVAEALPLGHRGVQRVVLARARVGFQHYLPQAAVNPAHAARPDDGRLSPCSVDGTRTSTH